MTLRFSLLLYLTFLLAELQCASLVLADDFEPNLLSQPKAAVVLEGLLKGEGDPKCQIYLDYDHDDKPGDDEPIGATTSSFRGRDYAVRKCANLGCKKEEGCCKMDHLSHSFGPFGIPLFSVEVSWCTCTAS